MVTRAGTERGWRARLDAQFGDGTTARKVAAATLVVGAFTLAAKGTALVRELLSAAYFGTSDSMDAFVIAFLLPTFVVSIAINPLASAFIPTYVEVREREGRPGAERLLAGVTWLVVGMVVLLSIGVFQGRDLLIPLLSSGFDPTKRAETTRLLLLLLPTVLLTAVATLWSAVLNAEERFLLPSASPIIIPAASGLAVWLLAPRYGVTSLAIGLLVGGVVQCTVLALTLRRSGVSVVAPWTGWDPTLRRAVGQYAPMVAGGILTGGNDVIDQAMAATLAAGSVAALNYGGKLDSLVISVTTLSLGTALLPQFSRLVTAGAWGEIDQTLRTLFRTTMFLAVPLTALLVAFSAPIVRLLFQRGQFTEADTAIVAAIQACFLLQVPFRVINTMLVRLLSALKRNALVMTVGFVALPLNVLGNIIGMRWLGAPGIALSTSVVYAVLSLYLALRTRAALAEARASSGGGG